MGAGHDGAARELAARLRSRGHDAEVRDILDAAPLRLGALLRRVYELELRHAPGAYDRTYRLWYRVPWLCPVVAWLVCCLTQRRLLRWVRRSGAEVVVSTYPLATLSLGRLRRIGRLVVPTVNFITDFGVHPLWVHRGIDLNLAVHPSAAEIAHRRSQRPSVACGPLVADAFSAWMAAEARDRVRAELGLRPDDRAVLVVAGSWGVGDIEETFDAVASGAVSSGALSSGALSPGALSSGAVSPGALSPGGAYVPVVVCGRDGVVRRRLQARAESAGRRAVVLGWTERMPELMAACDALVENAGGLTSLEALRAGLPVVSYHPIAGHGKENTSAMAGAGVSRLAADRAELLAALDVVTRPGRDQVDQVAAGARIFASDGAAHVLGVATPAARAALRRPARGRVAWTRASRLAASIGAAAAIAWGGLTTGVGVATAFGAGVAHGNGPFVYVGVRLTAAQLLDPLVDRTVAHLGYTLVLDRTTAFTVPTSVEQLANEDVDIEDGGQGEWDQPTAPTPWRRALGDMETAQALRELTGEPVRFFVAEHGVNAFDLIDASHTATIVVPTHQIDADATVPAPAPTLRPRDIVLVNGLGATDGQLLDVLRQLQVTLAHDDLTAFSIDALSP